MKNIALLLLSVIFISCSHNKQMVDDLQSVWLDKAEKIDIEDYIEDVSCVILEESTIHDCWKIIEYKDFLYLYSLSDFAISIYTSSGELVKNITSSGVGSVTFPTSIYVEKNRKQLLSLI